MNLGLFTFVCGEFGDKWMIIPPLSTWRCCCTYPNKSVTALNNDEDI